MSDKYPLQLYRASYEDTVVVHDEDAEAAARAEGFEHFAEIYEREGQFPAPENAVPVAEEPQEEAPKKRGRPAKAE